MLFCPKILSLFAFFFFGFLFYFHDVECMCIKRRDTYDQWIVAETCSILFLFVKICNSVFRKRFNWKPWFLSTLTTELDSPSEIFVSSRNHSYKKKAEYVWKSLKRKEFGEGLMWEHTFRSIFDDVKESMFCLLASPEVSSLFETRSVTFTKLSWKLIVFCCFGCVGCWGDVEVMLVLRWRRWDGE